MRKFLREIVLYSVPLILFFAVATLPGYNSGEFRDFDDAIVTQRENSSVIIGMGYNEQTPYYKLSNANYYEADIIALGTSRAMQFKEEFFQESFYNCGGAVSGNYSEYKNFLSNLTYRPKIVLLDLDAWVFNDAWNNNLPDYSQFQQISQAKRSVLSMTVKMYLDLLERKWGFSDLKNYSENIGFNGRIKGDGFMADGSYYYSHLYRDPTSSDDYQFKDTLSRIERGVSRFEYGKHIDKDTLAQLDDLLHYCNENDIQVIGYLAPFAPSIYQRMVSSGNYGYLLEISPACEHIFKKYGHEYFDFSDGAMLEATDEFFIDGFHGSEIVYGIMLEKMIQADSLIAKYVDKERLDSRMANRYNSWLFDEPI